MREVKRLSCDEFDDEKRAGLMLLACDEAAIRCDSMPHLQEIIGAAGLSVVLAMPDNQYRQGLRGWVKARVLVAVTKKVEGVLPLSYDDMREQLVAGWGVINIPWPLRWNTAQVIDSSEDKKTAFLIDETDDPGDISMIGRARKLTEKSNCWQDPAGCVVVKGEEVLVEGASTRFNSFNCPAIPLKFRDVELNLGERMLFCDSLHAERVSISEAARRGVSLEGSTIYVTKFPCRPCAESVIAAGVKEVVFGEDSYGLIEVGDLFQKNRVSVRRVKEQRV